MARINLDDSLFGDFRFMALVGKLGPYEATGLVVWALRMAQKYFVLQLDAGTEQRGIPVPVYQTLVRGEALLEVGLAVRSECGEFIKLDGTEAAFEWLKQRKNAGRNSANTRSGKIQPNQSNVEIIEEKVQRPLDSVERSLNGFQPLSSLFLDPKEKEKNITKKEKETAQAAEAPVPGRRRVSGRVRGQAGEGKTWEPRAEFSSELNRPLLSGCSDELQAIWLKNYPSDFVRRELDKAREWLLAQGGDHVRPAKGAFASNWLSRAWERHLQTHKDAPQTVSTTFVELEPIHMSLSPLPNSGEKR